MDKKESIQFLRQALGAIPKLSRLTYDNHEYPLWRNQIEDILETVFGRDSREYQRFTEPHPNRVSTLDHSAENRWYYDELKKRETAILSIIKKYENLGIEEKPANTPKESTDLPISLFDAMQFHPKVVEACRSCFIAGNYREAILNSFIALTDYVKEKTKLKTDNKDLMAKAFDLEKPVIALNSLTEQYERDEQEGFRFLYMGASVGIRNPKAHKLIPQTNPLHTLEYLALSSLLFRRIDEGKINTPGGA